MFVQVSAITVGVNDYTCAPDVPKAFVWSDIASGKDVIALFHAYGCMSSSSSSSSSSRFCLSSFTPSPSDPDNPGPDSSNPLGLSRSNCVIVDRLSEALCFVFRTDNSGPPLDIDEVLSNYDVIQNMFPGAQVFASTLDAFLQVLLPVKQSLPVVTGEIGCAPHVFAPFFLLTFTLITFFQRCMD
jgi:hypothetical protein